MCFVCQGCLRINLLSKLGVVTAVHSKTTTVHSKILQRSNLLSDVICFSCYAEVCFVCQGCLRSNLLSNLDMKTNDLRIQFVVMACFLIVSLRFR